MALRSAALAPSLCFTVLHAPLLELALQGAQRQTVIPAKLVLPQSACLEFRHQPLDLFTASSLPLRDFLLCPHPHTPPKKPADE
jgi:hypothetical protein